MVPFVHAKGQGGSYGKNQDQKDKLAPFGTAFKKQKSRGETGIQVLKVHEKKLVHTGESGGLVFNRGYIRGGDKNAKCAPSSFLTESQGETKPTS